MYTRDFFGGVAFAFGVRTVLVGTVIGVGEHPHKADNDDDKTG